MCISNMALQAFSLTDHDTVRGIEEAVRESRDLDLFFLPGLELSIGFGREEIHILGYGFDYRNRQLLDTLEILGAEREERMRKMVASLCKLGIPADTLPPWNMHWLGLFSRRPIGHDRISPLEALGEIMLEKLTYNPGERDMVVLFHEFKAWFAADDHYERLTSSLVDFGIRYGDSSMSRTVSLPAAIAARLILEGKITSRGVLRPVIPEIYNPVLDELANVNIVCAEEKTVY